MLTVLPLPLHLHLHLRVILGVREARQVYGCMYPFMNCKNQMYMARHLCQDDGYWIREIQHFNCTGGFIASVSDEVKFLAIAHIRFSRELAN